MSVITTQDVSPGPLAGLLVCVVAAFALGCYSGAMFWWLLWTRQKRSLVARARAERRQPSSRLDPHLVRTVPLPPASVRGRGRGAVPGQFRHRL